MNTNHVIKMNMHKTAFYIAVTVQLMGSSAPDPFFLGILPLAGHKMLGL